MAHSKGSLDVSTLEGWLWEAACQIRGPLDAPKFKDYILPLIFLKRLSDVFEDEYKRLVDEFGDEGAATDVAENDRRAVRFYVPKEARWPKIRQRTTGLGEYLTDAVRAVARENPRLEGVVNVVDFNATAAGQPIVDEGRLAALVQILSRYRLGLEDVEPDILGRAYEYLLRKFAEGQGQSAGEFYTPREIGVLMARILDPEPGMEVYDPTCGSAGLLIKCHLRLLETHGEEVNGHRELPSHTAPLKLYGQEINPSTFAMAKMNATLHEMQAEVALGDTMNKPAFRDESGQLERFDLITANPMWNQKFPTEVYEHDPYERFGYGIPPSSSADWGWVQHMGASLSDGGRMAVVLDTGAVSRGSGNTGSNKERDIRKAFVEGDLVSEGDLIEAVILLPENLFYNTTAPGIVLVINKKKSHSGEVLLINGSKLFSKGRPKNYLTGEHIDQIASIYRDWREEEGLSAIVSKEEIVKNDFNLSPSRATWPEPSKRRYCRLRRPWCSYRRRRRSGRRQTESLTRSFRPWASEGYDNYNETMSFQVDISREEIERLCERYHVERLSLFGSVLREDFGPESDVDVLVEFEDGHTPGLGFVRLQRELSGVLGRQVDLHTYHSLSRYFRDEVVRQSEVVYERVPQAS